MRRVGSLRCMAPHRAVLVALLGLAGCATPGPRTFQVATNLEPAAGRACAWDVLRRHGFEAARDTLDDGALVAMRRPVRTVYGPGEWWRVEVSVTTAEDGRTLVTSVAGASARETGPFTARPDGLLGVGGEISARCMWGKPPSDTGSSR
ncbi:MAG: hypothetical protein Q8N53_03725 [Longimicrobiales bacterium]|nr:hypothetical protein [Longimicrobiales bacterium]